MARIEKSIVINAPVEKVFAFVNDFDNFVKTQPPGVEMESLSQDEGPCRVGFKRKVRSKIGDQVLESEVEFTEFEENKKVLKEIGILEDKIIRNKVAGYAATLMKKSK